MKDKQDGFELLLIKLVHLGLYVVLDRQEGLVKDEVNLTVVDIEELLEFKRVLGGLCLLRNKRLKSLTTNSNMGGPGSLPIYCLR